MLLYHVFKVFTGDIDSLLESFMYLCEENDLSVSVDSKDVIQNSKVSIIMQATLLFTGVPLTQLLSLYTHDKLIQSKSIKKFISKLKEYAPIPEEIDAVNENIANLLPALFEADFFKEISEKLLSNFKKLTNREFNEQSVLGIMIGLAIQNQDLIISSLVSLIEKIKNTRTKALIALILKDASQESALQFAFKELYIPHKLGLNLLELADTSNKSGACIAALNI